jgi:phosphatidylethanolamine/phosphatidyl-N-methylethanolamine N-methyltransferase
MRRPILANSLPFLLSWSRDPIAVGLPFASSYWSARRIARAALDAAVAGAGPVLELGAGTGPVTQALVDAGCPADQIVAVERDEELCRCLEKRFAGLHVLHGDALRLGKVIANIRAFSARVVLSGLPMRAVPPELAWRCYADALRFLPSGGAIIQYTYGFRPPVDPTATALEATFVGREWRNLPPIGIWSYREPGHGAASPPTRTLGGRAACSGAPAIGIGRSPPAPFCGASLVIRARTATSRRIQPNNSALWGSIAHQRSGRRQVAELANTMVSASS